MKPDFSTAPLDTLLAALSEEASQPPHAAFAAADARRSELTPPLLAALVAGIDDPTGVSSEQATLFCHALYLLAKWRATEALPLVLGWLRLPGEGAFDIADDIVTEGGPRILASVCGGDIARIKSLVEDAEAEEFCRSMAMLALQVLVAWGEWPRAELEAYVRELAETKLARVPSHVWDELAIVTSEAGFTSALPAIRAAFADDLVDEEILALDEVEDDVAVGGRWEEFVEMHPPITDVAAETEWWSCYHEPVRRDEKVGRNEDCPCGSGKKYKQCCGRAS